MINPQWLELPMSWTIFYGPKDVWAIEVRLYVLKTNGWNLQCMIKEVILFSYHQNFGGLSALAPGYMLV